MFDQVNDRSEIYKVSLDVEKSNDVRIIAQSLIEPGKVVLDVGCACGDLGAMLKQTKDAEMYGMEYDPRSINIAKMSGSYKDIHQVDLNSFQAELFPHYLGKFDYIIVLDVLEHLMYPKEALKSLMRLLSPQGYMILSLPNISHGSIKAQILRNEFNYTDMGILDRTHLRFFTHKSIVALLTELNMRLIMTHARVVGFADDVRGLPLLQRRFISKDPHSFVFQYVIMIQVSKPGQLSDGLDELPVPWHTLRPTIRLICRCEWKNRWLPKGTLRHKVVKYLYQFLGR